MLSVGIFLTAPEDADLEHVGTTCWREIDRLSNATSTSQASAAAPGSFGPPSDPRLWEFQESSECAASARPSSGSGIPPSLFPPSRYARGGRLSSRGASSSRSCESQPDGPSR